VNTATRAQPRLHGRRAVITGGGAGIGAAVARVFCAEGAAVMLIDRDAPALAATRAALLAVLPEAQVLTAVAEVADEAALTAAIQRAEAELGGIDILVNNAAMRHHGPLADASSAQWQAVLGVNLMGTSNGCRAALPALRRSGIGAIVNVSSCYAVTGRAGMGLYDATKAGILSITRTLAVEEAAHGVRVNAVCPGSTLTEFHLARARVSNTPVEVLKTQRQTTSILGRWADPAEIAWPVLWLASAEASYITGTTLMVDGGLHAQ
jgi:meso-butanediol dehydrogenase/(S,S)-butanediol dehydrogenase/diacetyl reductase